jgi:sterol desaturase/sphingolipid hydroxylase (fatty acid hydroxylase superfamily)
MTAAQLDIVRMYRIEIALFVVLYAFAEVVWLRLRKRRDPALPDVLANVFIYMVDTGIRLATWPARLAAFVLVGSLSPLRIETGIASAALCYLGVDLILYCWHRVLHETELGWAMHSVHHTSRELNVSVGVRINWLQRAIDDLVYLPLAALGFEPLLVLAMVTLNRFWQYWIHTEMIGKIPLLDPWLNTPSNHRVHHALFGGARRANYGSTFMIFDHLFGTYGRETGELEYGSDAGDLGANPITIQLAGLRDYVRKRLGA